MGFYESLLETFNFIAKFSSHHINKNTESWKVVCFLFIDLLEDTLINITWN